MTGTVAQGVYGDEQATVWVYWGGQVGGTTRGNWPNRVKAGVNHRFNPAPFTGRLTNLPVRAEIFFRFYVTNASGDAWAPATGRFSTELVDPAAFAHSMTIAFTGYTRPEPHVNFPALAILRRGQGGFDYPQCASSSGADLRFTDATGRRVIDHEFDQWNTNAASFIWVRVPGLAGPDDFIRAYWV